MGGMAPLSADAAVFVPMGEAGPFPTAAAAAPTLVPMAAKASSRGRVRRRQQKNGGKGLPASNIKKQKPTTNDSLVRLSTSRLEPSNSQLLVLCHDVAFDSAACEAQREAQCASDTNISSQSPPIGCFKGVPLTRSAASELALILGTDCSL